MASPLPLPVATTSMGRPLAVVGELASNAWICSSNQAFFSLP